MHCEIVNEIVIVPMTLMEIRLLKCVVKCFAIVISSVDALAANFRTPVDSPTS